MTACTCLKCEARDKVRLYHCQGPLYVRSHRIHTLSPHHPSSVETGVAIGFTDSPEKTRIIGG